MTPVPHPPYPLDLAPIDFFFLSPMEKVLKGKCFANVEEVKQKTAETLKSTSPKTILSSGKKRLNRCIASNGEYFEGD